MKQSNKQPGVFAYRGVYFEIRQADEYMQEHAGNLEVFVNGESIGWKDSDDDAADLAMRYIDKFYFCPFEIL